MQYPQTSPVEGLLSVIICNYNYERFVAAAIESALAIDWPQVEIIVVDDGSTDNSRAVIDTFVPKGIVAIYGENKGQVGAAAEGYRVCRGQWILFLDSDDFVDRSIMREAAAVMKPGWSMVQFQMAVVDEFGKSSGHFFPKYRDDVTPQMIRHWISETDAYPTPPTSGNILSREFLDKIYPFEEDMDRAIDSYFLSTAPLLGDVLTVNKPCVSYRHHQSNRGAQSKFNISKVQADLKRHCTRCSYGTRMALKYGAVVDADRWRYSFYNLAMRIASLRLAPDSHPLEADTVLKCLGDWTKSLSKDQGMSTARHATMALWILSVALAPRAISQPLVSWRFAPTSRPQLLKTLIRAT